MILTLNDLTGDHLPPQMKRTFISSNDKKMVYKAEMGGFKILFSNATTDRSYIANIYYQSNMFLRVLSKYVEKSKTQQFGVVCKLTLAQDEITRRHEQLLRGEITWIKAFEGLIDCDTRKQLKKILSKNLGFICKAAVFNVHTDNSFNNLALLKSYLMQVHDMPECIVRHYLNFKLFKYYLNGGFERKYFDGDNVSVCRFEDAIDHAWRTRQVKQIDNIVATNFDRFGVDDPREVLSILGMRGLERDQWLAYIMDYTKDIALGQKLISLRDHFKDLSERDTNYKIIYIACKKLLL